MQWPPQADKLRVQGKDPLLSLQQLGELSLASSSETLPVSSDASSRTPAWTGARGSTYSPSPASPRQHPTQAPPILSSFPPLAQINGARPDIPRDRVLQALSGLTVCSYFSIYLSSPISRYLGLYLGYDRHPSDKNFSAL